MAPKIDVEILAKRTGFPRLLTIVEAAALARAPIKSVRFWISSGRLASSRPGRLVLIRLDDLEAFVAGKPQPSREDTAA